MYSDLHQHPPHDPYYEDWSSLPLDFSEFLNQDLPQNEFASGDSFAGLIDFDFEAVLATTSNCDTAPPTTATSSGTSSTTIPASALTTTQDNLFTTQSAPADSSPHDWHGLNNLTPPPSVTAPDSSKDTSPAVLSLKPATVSPVPTDSPEDAGETRKRKRERNTEAARRYRQRRQDRLDELEEALAAMTKDRDELRIKLARSEAEAEVLRGLVGKK